MRTSRLEYTRASAVAPDVQEVAAHKFEASIAEEWDSYVLGSPQASFFHLTGWQHVLEKTYGYRSFSLYTERGGKITGVVPLFLISNRVMGKCLMSVPFGVYGGIVADDEPSAQHLLRHVRELAHSLRVEYLELRIRKSELLPDFHPNSRYATFTSQLTGDHHTNLKRLPRDTRYMIRKGEKAGLTTRHGLDQMDTFYRLFAQNMHQHGTPVFPRRFFDNLRLRFERQLDLMLVYSGVQPIGGVLSFLFRDAILPYYAGVSPLSRPLAGNDFLYWELMKWAAERGVRTFDFGRSKKGTGAYAFKMGWDMTVEPLDYQVYLVRRKTPPNFSPTNPKFEFATRIWKRIPLWATLVLGPRISPWFP